MIMRRILLVLAALIIGLGSVSAKKRKEVKNDLVGVWQQVNTSPYTKGQYRPILKIIDKDGTFSTMFIYQNQMLGRVTQKGTFKVQNDSVYTETIKQHMFPHIVGDKVTIKFRFADKKNAPPSDPEFAKDILIMELSNGAREMWVRISDREIAK